MKFMIITNQESCKINDIPVLAKDSFRTEILNKMSKGYRVISFFGHEVEKEIQVFCFLADDQFSTVHITSVFMQKGDSYESLTVDYPQFHLFERELFEEYKINPLNHPWLKPVRYPYYTESGHVDDYNYFGLDSEELHEIAVGPIHAGIIEPGHFRFICDGEKVIHLEIKLGYQHRGVEKLLVGEKQTSRHMHIAESIAGDTVIGHGLAYAHTLETLAGVTIDHQADFTRAIALELERVALHIADLAALANDVAYITPCSYLGHYRTAIINHLLELCGNRFGRNLIIPGGMKHYYTPELIEKLRATLQEVIAAVSFLCDTMFSNSSVIARFEQTGIVTEEEARSIGLTGPAARASSVKLDCRSDHPFGFYKQSHMYSIVMETGDVMARAYQRFFEIQQSIHFILEHLNRFDTVKHPLVPVDKLAAEAIGLSLVEGWRGEIVHVALTDATGSIIKYKIKDPSFNNWFGLALAVRNNQISDFPLCNKSFNLSYCGYDL